VAVGFGGASGYLEMNVYKPLMISNVMQSLRILADGCHNFRVFLIEGTEPNRRQIDRFVERSLMLVTALSPVIGYDRASKIAHYANDHDLTLREAALKLGWSAPRNSIASSTHTRWSIRTWPPARRAQNDENELAWSRAAVQSATVEID